MKKIILASTSPRRKQIMDLLGISYETVSTDYEEDMTKKMLPKSLAKHLSAGKALSVANKYKNSIIISADTFIVFKNELMGKPHTEKKAKEMLKKISGKTISVITGYTILDTKSNKKLSRAVETKLVTKKITDSQIANYIKKEDVLKNAGAFRIQDLGAILFKKIEGDYMNIVGLPLSELVEDLKKFGIKII